MKKIELPKIGLRNLKTALAVFICMVIFDFFNNTNGFFACIAAVMCLKDTVESSVTMGKNRLLGTGIGGIIGLFAVFILDNFHILINFRALIAAMCISLAIYICTIIKRPGSVIISCIVISAILCNYNSMNPYYYAIGRMFDTGIGVVVAILVNKFVNPPVS